MTGLPQGWEIVRFEEMVLPDAPIIYGILQPGPEYPEGIKYVRPTEIQDGSIDLSSVRRTSPEIAAQYERSKLAAGDVILSIVGTIGKVARVPGALEGANITQSSCRLRPDRNLTSEQYLQHFLKAPQAVAQYDRKRMGTAVPRLNLADVRQFEIPLPPLTEQRRIVRKLGTLSARSTTAGTHIAAIEKLVKRYRQALLAAAFRGDLSKEWRSQCEPSSWKHLKASEVCEIVQSGGTPNKECFLPDDGIPFLKVYNIVNQEIDFAYRPQFITPKVHNSVSQKSKIKPRDVLMNIVGPPLGKIAIVPDDFPEWNCNQAITIFRPSHLTSSEWIFYFLNSGTSVASVIRETRGVVGQVNISLSQCRDFLIPIPSIEEQREIVRRIKAAFAKIDHVAAEAAKALKLLGHLDQRILAKAFAGDLVPQDPTEEPAETLLARVREARAAAPKGKRGRKSGAS